ncbi:MAG: OmcA/MtrC family decaheme c-type cytochrome [Bryobacteraceae bacterium]
MRSLLIQWRTAALVVVIALSLGGASKSVYSPRDKAYYASPDLVAFVQPGLVITINSASINSAGAISVTYTVTDPSGLPLDVAGVNTPGAISLTYFAAYIPKGQEQYVSYTTATATGAALGTVTRPTFEEGGGTVTTVGPGQYTYIMTTKAPAGFDPTVTTTIGMSGSRDLTSFSLGTNYAGATFNFVPNGSAVTVTRDVIRTASCNACHIQLAFHGGHAFGIQECVLCHQPQNVDPTTGNSLDLKVMAHKIHMGSQLPSVVGTTTTPGVPYEIAGYMGAFSNFSTVKDPADPRRCEVCHSQTTGAAQAKAFMTEPSRAACGACHDDVNFATGLNHPGGFQNDDTQCANCHIPQGETPFDASILGAHVVNTDTAATYPQNPDTLLAGINLVITSVTNTSAGQTPTVNFTLKDNSGNGLAISSTTTVTLTMSGPTTDYGATNFGANSTTPGYVSESPTAAACNSSGVCSYTFTHPIPAGSTGTYAIGGEARTAVTVLAGTTASQSVSLGAPNPVVYFSVDGSAVAPRRAVVAQANCLGCHVTFSGGEVAIHGGLRNNVEYCVLCHNPSNTDFTTRPSATVASYQSQPNQGINFNLLVHRIHDGVNAATNPLGPPKNPYVVVGHSGSINDFSGILFPAMSPTGSATYMQDCSLCHVNSSEQNDLTITGLNPVTDPQGWINPNQPFSSACGGCHVSKTEASHFLANTDSLGESCAVCHGSGGAYAVDQVHAQ